MENKKERKQIIIHELEMTCDRVEVMKKEERNGNRKERRKIRRVKK